MTKFDHGDAVLTKRLDDQGIRQRPAWVVGITTIATSDEARTFGYPIGTTLYTVEFEDGSDTVLAENALESLSDGSESNLEAGE
jgi:hypothetical protein